MPTDDLTRARDIEALVYLQYYATNRPEEVLCDRASRASDLQAQLVEALAPLGLPETPQRIGAAARCCTWFACAMRASARLIIGRITSHRVRSKSASTRVRDGIEREPVRERTR